jgi:sigma-B regulation protein RsbU (phosphoserine phosphatase)
MSAALMDELESTEMYLTLFYGVVDPADGELVYANAGHPHAFAIRNDGRTERLHAMDPPMGIAGTVEYQERSVPWVVGKDLLFLFTDGLSDDLIAETRSAGEDLLLRTAVENRDRPVCEIVAALFDMERREWQGGVRVGDDRTAVVFRA